MIVKPRFGFRGASVVKCFVRFASENVHSCKLLVLGGGSGGCSMAAKFVPKLGKNNVIIVDPAETHYYQPMLTLVGGGIKKIDECGRPMGSVLPKGAKWLKESVIDIDPVKCQVRTDKGSTVNYEYMIVSLGLELHFNKVKGLVEALENPGTGVCSNYSPKYASRTFNILKRFKGGNAIFTFPNTPIKCGGAPLKACFISEHFVRKAGQKDKSKFFYKTSLPVIFSVKRYGDKLLELCKQRDIDVAFKEDLIEVNSLKGEAIFKSLDRPNETTAYKYSMLHAVPPMGPPEVLSSGPEMTDHAGYLKVNKASLQHDNYQNIFGIGDCTNLPTSKTAAAVACQSGILYDNLNSVMKGTQLKGAYDGYTSCPLVTGFGTCIMAEFDYDLRPLETFPIDQSNEHYSMYLMKTECMPILYWNAMLKGYWRGPGAIRKILHLGLGR